MVNTSSVASLGKPHFLFNIIIQCHSSHGVVTWIQEHLTTVLDVLLAIEPRFNHLPINPCPVFLSPVKNTVNNMPMTRHMEQELLTPSHFCYLLNANLFGVRTISPIRPLPIDTWPGTLELSCQLLIPTVFGKPSSG